MVKVGIKAGSQCVERITNASIWRGSPRYQRLRPEPDSQRNGREQNSANDPAPVMRAFGICHFQKSPALTLAVSMGRSCRFRDFQSEFARLSQIQLACAE